MTTQWMPCKPKEDSCQRERELSRSSVTVMQWMLDLPAQNSLMGVKTQFQSRNDRRLNSKDSKRKIESVNINTSFKLFYCKRKQINVAVAI